ncbi:MAG: hypothetical protein JO309_05640 [Pseudonocardiales bacterium]|nr:hypothetical protein [Pseudonocardiales bacterium]MBV9728882.1 hypothetical protein [Pseudonocardiales bacterium]
MLIPPELLAGRVTAGRVTERRPGPAALTAGHVRQVAIVRAHSHVAPDIDERPIRPPADDNTLVFVGALADVSNPVQQHCTRILRLAERKMNAVCPNGWTCGRAR